MTPLTKKALAIALDAHAGANRKDGVTPYIAHPIAVAMTVAERGGSEVQIAAAFVHDVVEDTDWTLDMIERKLGGEVRNLVFCLTNPEIDGSRHARKQAARRHIALAPPAAQLIKLADRLDNVSDMDAMSESWRETYINETILLLEEIGYTDSVLTNKILEHCYPDTMSLDKFEQSTRLIASRRGNGRGVLINFTDPFIEIETNTRENDIIVTNLKSGVVALWYLNGRTTVNNEREIRKLTPHVKKILADLV